MDKTGVRCSHRTDLTNSSVFHLSGISGGTAEIECNIPAGLGLFINIISVEASQAELPNSTVKDLDSIAKNDQDNVTSTYLKIDDKEFKDLKDYRFHTSAFDVTFPIKAVFGARPGPSKVVADGYYVITSPLAPGNYSIITKGSLANKEPKGMDSVYATEVKYNLIVK